MLYTARTQPCCRMLRIWLYHEDPGYSEVEVDLKQALLRFLPLGSPDVTSLDFPTFQKSPEG